MWKCSVDNPNFIFWFWLTDWLVHWLYEKLFIFYEIIKSKEYYLIDKRHWYKCKQHFQFVKCENIYFHYPDAKSWVWIFLSIYCLTRESEIGWFAICVSTIRQNNSGYIVVLQLFLITIFRKNLFLDIVWLNISKLSQILVFFINVKVVADYQTWCPCICLW